MLGFQSFLWWSLVSLWIWNSFVHGDDEPYIMGYYSLDGAVGPVKKYQYREGIVKPRDWEVLVSRAEALGHRGEFYRSIWVYNSVFKRDYLYGQMTPGQRYRLHLSLGKMLMKIGMLDRAEITLYEAVSLHPEPYEAHFALAALTAHDADIRQATIHLKNCLYFQPDHLLALKNLGSLLYASGNIAEGNHYLRRLVAFLQASDQAKLHQHQSSPALSKWMSSFIIDAFLLEPVENQTITDVTVENLNMVLEYPESANFFEIGLGLWDTGFWEMSQHHMKLAQDFAVEGNSTYETVIRVRTTLEFPGVVDSKAHLADLWSSLENRIEEFLDDLEYNKRNRLQMIRHPDLLQHICAPISILHWQALPMKSILRDITHLLEGICPDLFWQSPAAVLALETGFLSMKYQDLLGAAVDASHEVGPRTDELVLLDDADDLNDPGMGKRKKRRRRHRPQLDEAGKPAPEHEGIGAVKGSSHSVQVHVGLVSSLFSLHPVGRIALSILHSLKSPDLRFTVFVFPFVFDEVTHHMRNLADQFVVLPKNVSEARETIASIQPSVDILLFPDWLDPLTYLLSHARLAPIQAAFSVRGGTLGTGSMDYYFMGEYLRTGNHLSAFSRSFSEQIVELKGMGWPPISWVPFSSEEPIYEFLGYLFYDSQNLYAVAAPARQLHPRFDDVLVKILQEDPNGVLVFLSVFSGLQPTSEHSQWYRRVLKRIKKKIKLKSVADTRVILLPPLSHWEHLSFLSIASVLLDTFPISSPTSVMEALLQTNTPLVSLNVSNTNGDYGFSFGNNLCAAMKVDFYCSASSLEMFVDLALSIGMNSTLQYKIQQEIKEAAAVFQSHSESFAPDFHRALVNIGIRAAQSHKENIAETSSSASTVNNKHKKKKNRNHELKIQPGVIRT